MSRQATAVAKRIRAAMEAETDSTVSTLALPETPIPWPGQPKPLWPVADISGRTSTGEVLIVEIDDHADPARSVVKYWPLLHAMANEGFPYDPIAFVEVSGRDDTYGLGYQLLARFVGQRLAEGYPEYFRFRYVDLGDGDPGRIARAILAFVSEGRGSRSSAWQPQGAGIQSWSEDI